MKYRNSKSTLFLMELIIAILFFAVTSAVCAQIFAKSHILSTKTTRLNHAVAQAESAAESFKAVNGAMDDIAVLFPGSVLDGNTLTIYYDAGWQLCTVPNSVAWAESGNRTNPGSAAAGAAAESVSGTNPGSAAAGAAAESVNGAKDLPATDSGAVQPAYVLTLTRLEDDGHCVRARIDVVNAGDSDKIYTLDIQKYVKGRRV